MEKGGKGERPNDNQWNILEKPRIKVLKPEDRTSIKVNVLRKDVFFEGRQIDYFQQKNASDCGPCMCLNMQDMLNAKSNADWVTDVNNFRQWAEQNSTLPSNHYTGEARYGWLKVVDMLKYIREQLGLETIAIEENNLSQLNNLMSRDRDSFVWGITGNHYHGYFCGQNKHYYNVNSFNDRPLASTLADVVDFVHESMREQPLATFITYAPKPEQEENGAPRITFNPKPKITTNRQNSFFDRKVKPLAMC